MPDLARRLRWAAGLTVIAGLLTGWIAGRISPQTAINQLRGLVQNDEPFLPARLPVIEQAWR